MGYGSLRKNENSGATGSYLEAGLHANVELTDVTFESPRKDGTGDPVLQFHFASPKGVYRHLEFPVNEDMIKSWGVAQWKRDRVAKKLNKPTVTDAEVLNESIQEAYDRQGYILTAIGSAVLTAAEVESLFEGLESYEDLGKKCVAVFKNRTAGVKLFLKLVYNKKDRTQLPNFGEFLEAQGENEAPKSLRLNTKDKIEKTEPDTSGPKKQTKPMDALGDDGLNEEVLDGDSGLGDEFGTDDDEDDVNF